MVKWSKVEGHSGLWVLPRKQWLSLEPKGDPFRTGWLKLGLGCLGSAWEGCTWVMKLAL